MLLLSFITGCTRNKANELKPVVNDKNSVTIELFNKKADFSPGPITMSEFVDSVKFIALEETDESLIKSLNKIIFTAEYVIVVDREQGIIFFFDKNGKYIKKISQKGQGPGEYTSIASCMLDEKQQLIIYDILAKKILFYDLDGNFLKQISNFSENTVIRDIINLPNGNFLCYTFDLVGEAEKKYTGLWEVDTHGKFLHNYFTYNVKLPVTFGEPPHFQQLSKGVISLRDNTHNDIYHYHNGAVELYISYNIKDNMLPDMIGASRFGNEPKNIRAAITQEKGDFIITLWFDEAGEPLFSLFSKNNNKMHFWDAYLTCDPAVPGVLFYPVDSNISDILVCDLNKYMIDKYLADTKLPKSVRNALEIGRAHV